MSFTYVFAGVLLSFTLNIQDVLRYRRRLAVELLYHKQNKLKPPSDQASTSQAPDSFLVTEGSTHSSPGQEAAAAKAKNDKKAGAAKTKKKRSAANGEKNENGSAAKGERNEREFAAMGKKNEETAKRKPPAAKRKKDEKNQKPTAAKRKKDEKNQKLTASEPPTGDKHVPETFVRRSQRANTKHDYAFLDKGGQSESDSSTAKRQRRQRR